jgi:DNA invertase Pin-like site-specific DNA recombinase
MSKVKTQTELFLRSDLLSLPTKSAQIRFLFQKGITKSEIALILNIRYQHVRNVLNYNLKK